MEMRSERLLIREPAKNDIEILSKELSNDKIYATTYGIPRNFSKDYAKWWVNFVKSSRKNKTGYEFVIYDTKGEFIGCCAVNGINKDCNRGNLTYLIKPELWGKGYATEAGKLMLDFGFNVLGLERISGICMAENIPSEKVLIKLGFTYEGLARHEIRKDGRYYDVKHFGILNPR